MGGINNSNTSHVIVNLSELTEQHKEQSYSNTSHVIVNLAFSER